MSIPVEIADLDEALAKVGTGFLLTASTAGSVKVVAAAPLADAGLLVVRGPGRGSVANAAANPTVTLLYPPVEAPGHSLIVDGTAEVDGDDIRIAPTGAVWHRPVS